MFFQPDWSFPGEALSQGISVTKRRTHSRYSSQRSNFFQIAHVQEDIRGMKTRADLKVLS